jgi:ligand-binding sensor domain-containing protein/DNA-binding CsgD family transcriptional regulator
MKHIVACLSVLFALVWPNLWAQHRVVKFKHLSVEQGLSHNIVIGIVQDHKGLMWFATDDGLNVYDGYRFRIYRHLPGNPAGLSSDRVWSVYEDRQKVLWAGTSGGGLNRYNRQSDTFTHYKADPAKPGSLSDNYVWGLYEDRTGVFWVGTISGGLHIMDRKTGVFTKCRYAPGFTPSDYTNKVAKIYEDSKGNIWVCTYNGFFRYDRKREVLAPYLNPHDNPDRTFASRVNDVCEDRTGVLWLGAYSGLYRFDPETGSYTPYKNKFTHHVGLFNSTVEAVHEDASGWLWVGTYYGLYKINPERDKSVEFKVGYPNVENFRSNVIYFLYEDIHGSLWVGTNRGVARYDGAREKFEHYRINDASYNDGRLIYDIFSIMEDRRGLLWLGTFNNGLHIFDRRSGRMIEYKVAQDVSANSNIIMTMREDNAGQVWVATDAGLMRIDRELRTTRHFKPDADDPGSISGNLINSLYEDPRGTLWVGAENGLNRFNPESQSFTVYKPPLANPNSKEVNWVVAMLESRSGVFWLGTFGGGLMHFRREDGQFTRYVHDPKNSNSLSHNRVYCLFEDPDGMLWIGTNNGGLNRFDPGTETFTCYTKKDGLPNNSILAIVADGNGYLWLSTSKGLSRFDPVKESFKNYHLDDGLQGYEYHLGSYFKNANGEMFFGGINGFNTFFPDRIPDNTNIPPVVITGFNIFNEAVPVGKHSPLKKHITEAGEVALSYRDAMFSFEFAALDYSNPAANRYKCKMEGFHESWIDLEHKHEMTFTGLEPGEYVFRVKGANNDGAWNEEGASIKVIITPPYWKTWWFRVLVAMVALFILISWYRVRISRLTLRYKTEAELGLIFCKYNLSNREQEIARLVLKGKTNKEIEDQLYISISTVKNHVYNIYQKLGVKNRLELINFLQKSAGK